MLYTYFNNWSNQHGRKQQAKTTTQETSLQQESKVILFALGFLLLLESLSYAHNIQSYYAHVLWSANLSTFKIIFISLILTQLRKSFLFKYLSILGLFAIIDSVLIFSLLIPENYNIIERIAGITDPLYRLAEIIILFVVVKDDPFFSCCNLYNCIHRLRVKFRSYCFRLGRV